ncbi:MaoC/PaaZ C-terminal domain-containing protein [Halopenitus sp. POP-27]|uniref:MaoC/PaaZ C-terminal domain-containing protein n=1 Tax=Halopenitus sp. POP-27 TaxID=2994425 RepID=UPI00246884F6|nr:MaoC/PaaZ C-terminal domain-containing protein [Halopenitus sp. POP-27]
MVQYYEDLEPGSEFEVGTFTLRRHEIVEFAERFDPQPFHLDEQAASESMFGQLIASGLHTLCVATRVFTEEYLQAEDNVAIMGGVGIDQLRWHQPVTPDQDLTLGVEIQSKSDEDCHPNGGYVDFKRTVANADGEPVMTDLSRGIIEKRPA